MKKVLITGATGFVGRYLAKHLSGEEFELYGTYLTNSGDELSKVATLRQIDLNESDSVNQLVSEISPDIIYHLAASTSPKESFEKPKATFENNVNTEINILEAVKNNNLKTRVMIISSAEIYGIVDSRDLPIDEGTPLNPSNPYAVSKLACDFLALQYFNSSKMDTVRIRPFNHTGPGQPPFFVIPAFAKKIAEIEKGKLDKLTVGNLESRRDFTDVRDIVRGYALICEKGKSGRAYNIGSGKSVKISEILNLLISMSDKKIEIEEDENLKMPIDNPDLVCDFTKLRELTGWKPEISLEQTLKETLDYWRGVV